MKAIVLSCDKYRALTNHMIYQYDKIWPNNPFRFYIPFQTIDGINSSKIKYIKSDINIKNTVLTLTNNLDDDEWIYWCIDDKYPIRFILPEVKNIYDWVTTIQSNKICGILFCRCRKLLNNNYLSGKIIDDNNNNIFLERNSFDHIWIHQFLRVKVLRYLFNAFPDKINVAKDMDFFKSAIKLPTDYQLYVSKINYAEFGESTELMSCKS